MKEKLFRIVSIFLSLWLVVYSFSPIVLFKAYYSYAQETCDPNDDDYQECLTDQEKDRQEEERERQRDEEEQKAEQVKEERETISEEHEDDPNWVAPWLITPTPVPSATSAPEPTITSGSQPTTSAVNSQTGEGSQNEALSNSASEIDVENINSTSLEQEQNVVANTVNNVVSEEQAPSSASQENPNPQNNGGNYQNYLPALSSDETDENAPGESEEGIPIAQDNLLEGTSQEESFNKDSSGETVNQGQDGNQVSISQNKDEVTVYNQNSLDLVNQTDLDSTSGQNSLTNNEGSASLESGQGEARADTATAGNINIVRTEDDGTAEAVNSQTEDNSANFTSEEVSQKTVVVNENSAAVENNLAVSSVSGQNDLSKNEGDATLTTNEVDIIVNLLNILNMNITGSDFTHLIVNIFGNLTGEFDLDDISEKYLGMDEDQVLAVAKNTDTGEDSKNEAAAKNEQDLDVNNKNNAAVVNNVEVAGVSGQNDLSENEDNVDVLTGRIKILTSILNFINANFSGTDWYFAMINIFGSLTGDISLPDPNKYLEQGEGTLAENSETGDDSQNQAQAVNNENINVSNENNAEVKNKVNAVGDSGTNSAYANEDETKTETGQVEVTAQIMNWINYNLFGNRFVMVVVNVFGRWLGKIIAFPGKGDIDAPENGTLVAVAQGQGSGETAVSAENGETGENSTNTATAESSSNLDVDNKNKAYLENNVDVTGVSGQNTTNENEDPVEVSTGWINLDVNLFNIVNFNVTGQHWLLLIVNVFGDFLGNIVFPHQEAPAAAQEESRPVSDIPPQEAVSQEPTGATANPEPQTAIESQGNSGSGNVFSYSTDENVLENNLINNGKKTQKLGEKEPIDNSINAYYNTANLDENSTYNLGEMLSYQVKPSLIVSFQKIIENLLNILSSLFINIF